MFPLIFELFFAPLSFMVELLSMEYLVNPEHFQTLNLFPASPSSNKITLLKFGNIVDDRHPRKTISLLLIGHLNFEANNTLVTSIFGIIHSPLKLNFRPFFVLNKVWTTTFIVGN
jgi:hypothetical protein